MPTRLTSRVPYIAVVLAGALLLGGCGDDDDGGSGSTSTPAATTQTQADAPAEATPLAVTVAKEGAGYTMTAPKEIEAGLVEIALTAPAGKGNHDVQIVRIEGEHSDHEILKVLAAESAPTPEWLFGAGGVGSTKGGTTGTVTQTLEPGSYMLADLSEPEGDNVKSYADQGATARLEVTGEAAEAELPATTATITAKDYNFVASGLTAGTNTILFKNEGKELHHVVAVPYAEGATLGEVTKFFSEENPTGRPPVSFEGVDTTAVLEGGTEQVMSLDLQKGKYALVCFISDRAGGPPHIAKGMIAEATIE